MIQIGLLSDTHITTEDQSFQKDIAEAFSNCSVIIHAGDLTDASILNVFRGKEVHAVHGNMCNQKTCLALPEMKRITIGGYLFGVCHGADGPRHTIEERMFSHFPEAHCIVYGHTHHAVCHRFGSTLIINPGSFRSTGKYGAPGTYAIVTIDHNGLHGAIHQLTRP